MVFPYTLWTIARNTLNYCMLNCYDWHRVIIITVLLNSLAISSYTLSSLCFGAHTVHSIGLPWNFAWQSSWSYINYLMVGHTFWSRATSQATDILNAWVCSLSLACHFTTAWPHWMATHAWRVWHCQLHTLFSLGSRQRGLFYFCLLCVEPTFIWRRFENGREPALHASCWRPLYGLSTIGKVKSICIVVNLVYNTFLYFVTLYTFMVHSSVVTW